MHDISVSQVRDPIHRLKSNKCDGNVGYNHNTNKLHVYLAFVLKEILRHSVAPEGFLTSITVPIPKANGKSVHDAHRGITLSSVFCKVMDYNILSRNPDIFNACDNQLGFRACASTTQRSFAVSDVIKYYNNRGSQVYPVMLDASEAFGRVEYGRLFCRLGRKVCVPYLSGCIH